jgi:Holliday junction resolvase RusA-like endonuclease
MIKLTIQGKPIPKKRPRFARQGKFVRTYSDQADDVKATQLIIKTQLKGVESLTGAVNLYAWFYMPIPQSTSNRRRSAMISGDIHHTKKPDLDNLVKFISDCLNGLAFQDDSQVVNINAVKLYGEEPRTEIQITEVEDEQTKTL